MWGCCAVRHGLWGDGGGFQRLCGVIVCGGKGGHCRGGGAGCGSIRRVMQTSQTTNTKPHRETERPPPKPNATRPLHTCPTTIPPAPPPAARTLPFSPNNKHNQTPTLHLTCPTTIPPAPSSAAAPMPSACPRLREEKASGVPSHAEGSSRRNLCGVLCWRLWLVWGRGGGVGGGMELVSIKICNT